MPCACDIMWRNDNNSMKPWQEIPYLVEVVVKGQPTFLSWVLEVLNYCDAQANEDGCDMALVMGCEDF